MIIQIYAFTNLDDALQAVALGVDHIGIVAGDYGIVHGELNFGDCRTLVEAIGSSARVSALTMAAEVGEILRMAHTVRPDIIHISTDPTVVGPSSMEELRRNLPTGVEIMKAIPVTDETSLDLALELSQQADILLLDSKDDGLPGVGASGRTHDWDLSRRIVKAVQLPVILAGGLSPQNVGSAIRTVDPAGVDSNTATNVAGDTVRKDMERVAAFVHAVQAQGKSGKP